MEEFLVASKYALARLYDYKRVKIMLGNESCDLDSVVCTLVHGLFHYAANQDQLNDLAIIPVLNINQKQFRVKTEVIYWLRELKIPRELLIFRDEIDLHELNNRHMLDLSLLDHHTLRDDDVSLTNSVVEVIDHRPPDPNWPWTGCDINLENVGSCATLVAKNILEKNSRLLSPQIARLLQGPILIDTCNFSESAARATPLDIQIMQTLEHTAGIASTPESREDIHLTILNAKTDISSLSPTDILEKDLKFVNGIPVPGLAILVEEFLNLNGALEAVNSFTRGKDCRLTVLLGMDLKGNVVRRDVAVFSFLPNDLENRINGALANEINLALSLVRSTSKENWSLKLYKQENVRATRKQIVPIIQSASADYW